MAKIAIIGFGKMGQAISEIASKRNHQLVKIDPHHPNADFKNIDQRSLAGVQVAIEFTSPSSVLSNIKKLTELSIPTVVGTTGWYNQISEVQEQVSRHNSSLIYGSNFSIGVNVFFKIVEAAAKIINNFTEFDIAGLDIHHNKKVDSPSGTAITTAEILINNISRKTKVIYDKLDRAPKENEIHFASLRSGSVPGTHQVFFDSLAESVNIEVVARSRDGYALGAVIAAEWLIGKSGFFKFEDLITSILQKN